MLQITKAELIDLLETDKAIEYVGKIQINTDMRLYYRTRIGAAQEPQGFILVYVVE